MLENVFFVFHVQVQISFRCTLMSQRGKIVLSSSAPKSTKKLYSTSLCKPEDVCLFYKDVRRKYAKIRRSVFQNQSPCLIEICRKKDSVHEMENIDHVLHASQLKIAAHPVTHTTQKEMPSPAHHPQVNTDNNHPTSDFL